MIGEWRMAADTENVDGSRPSWAIRFSVTMAALDPGVRVLVRWLHWVVVLVAVWRAPEMMSWLG
jgi:hypothetical protein